MIRCSWEMPENNHIESGMQCMKENGHGRIHAVATRGRGAATFWKVNTRKRTLRMQTHVDFRDGVIPTDDECLALYHYFRTVA